MEWGRHFCRTRETVARCTLPPANFGVLNGLAKYELRRMFSAKRERCGGVGIRLGRIRCSGLGHRTEGDRIARGLNWRDAMLPEMAGGAGHHVERAWLRVERETFPLVADLAAETEFAGRGEGEPEYLIEVLFVAVPADASADIILRA